MATSADKTPAPSTDDTESSNADVSISDQGSTTAVIPGVSINDVLEEPILPTGETLGLLKVLKSVCESGEVKNAETVLSSVLSTEPHFDCSAVDAEGNSPIHYASRKGHANIVQLLLERNFSPAIETHEGDTALHIASQCGHLDVVHTILQHKCNQDLECRNAILAAQNHDGLTALSCAVLNSHPDVAREILGFSTGNPMSSFPDFSNLFPNFISAVEPFALQEPMKLFIVGDRGTGKSTLAKALQSERSAWSKYTFGLVARGRSVREVDTHFTGVITTDFCSQGFGRVIFYDLAGHTNYFHEKLLESPEDLAKSIFIIVVNLRDGVQERLAYWMNFVQHHCSKFQNEASSSSKPHLLIIGSFNDQRKFWTTNWERGVLDSHMLSRRFNLLGKFSLNCRKVNSPEMSKVRSILQKQCQKMHHQFAPSSLPSALYVLSAVLDQEFGDQSPIPLKLLANKIAEQNTDSEPTLSKLLPPQPEELLSMCQVLQERKRIFFFKNSATDHVEETWLIPSTTVNTLLKRIDTALKGPPENAEADQRLHSNFGLVTSDSLQESLAAQLADLDINLTMQLLEHFRYCERVVPLESSPFAVQSSYFLPGLLPDPNNEMKVPHWESNERSGFSFAWCLTPIKGQEHLVEYFMPRFLKMLLLSLIRTFLPPSPDVAEATPSTTMVWSRGASWMTRDQVRACIITNDNSINLSMCCQGGSEIACLQLRNQIIATMRAEKEKWQPEIETEEIIIPAISQIVRNPETMKPHFSVSDMHASIKNGTSSITPNDASESSAPVSIESLLFFESCIPLQKLKRFHRAKIIDVARSSEEVSRGFLADLKRCLGEQFDIVAQHFNLPNIGSETSSTSASTPRASQEANIDSARFIPGAAQQADRSLTYGQMWKYLDSLSIFNTTELLQEVQVTNYLLIVHA